MLTNPSSPQKGSVLITTLVILTAVTLIAILSMQKSTTGLRMVGNTQLFESSFQVALSELNFTFNKYRNVQSHLDLTQAIQSPNTLQTINGSRNVSHYNQTNLAVQSQIRYEGSVNNIDHTLSGDNSIGMIKKHNFTIVVNANINNANIGSQQEKEFSFLARKAN